LESERTFFNGFFLPLPVSAFFFASVKNEEIKKAAFFAQNFLPKVAHKNSLWISLRRILKEIFFYHARA
jgi:hypothetical protein